jgi:choline transport protein
VQSCVAALTRVILIYGRLPEMPNLRRNVPRAMGLTIVIGLFTVIVWSIAFMFSIQDLEEVRLSAGPYMTVYLQAIGNKAGGMFFTIWLWQCYLSATTSCFATSGRLVWAFARDNGLLYSNFFRKVHPTLQMPVHATISTAVSRS